MSKSENGETEAKTILQIVGIEGASNPCELRQAICNTHCIGRCPSGTCSKLTNRWVSEADHLAKVKAIQDDYSDRFLKLTLQFAEEKKGLVAEITLLRKGLTEKRRGLGFEEVSKVWVC